MPLFHARGVFQYSFGLMPYRQAINTVGTTDSSLPCREYGRSTRTCYLLSLLFFQWGSLLQLSRPPVQPVRTSRSSIKFTCRVSQSCLKSTNTNMAFRNISTSPSYDFIFVNPELFLDVKPLSFVPHCCHIPLTSVGLVCTRNGSSVQIGNDNLFSDLLGMLAVKLKSASSSKC